MFTIKMTKLAQNKINRFDLFIKIIEFEVLYNDF